jgi:hemoglobin-like flavoprotein
MATSDVDVFRASLKRCLADNNFIHHFYDLFMASSPEVREKFKSTDFPRQARVLADSLYLMAVAAESKDDSIAGSELTRLAAKHSHTGLDIRPQLYQGWLDCLLTAARDYDPQFTPEIEASWRKALAPGIDHLRSAY